MLITEPIRKFRKQNMSDINECWIQGRVCIKPIISENATITKIVTNYDKGDNKQEAAYVQLNIDKKTGGGYEPEIGDQLTVKGRLCTYGEPKEMKTYLKVVRMVEIRKKSNEPKSPGFVA